MVTISAIDDSIKPAWSDRLDRFAVSTQTGVWPHLHKQQLIDEIAARLRDPYQLKQGQQPFCGPASVVFELVRRQPERYIEICQQIFETGRFEGYSRSIVAKEKLRRTKGNLRAAQIDWLLLGTLRAEANTIVPVHANTSVLLRNIGGMTKSWEIADWLKELLGYRQTEFTIVHRHESEAVALNAAAANLNAGGVSIILLNSQALLELKPLPISFPSHWVTLLEPVEIEPDGDRSQVIELPIYSWGHKIKIKATRSQLQKHLWGVVTGR
jgi:hypothetical protein